MSQFETGFVIGFKSDHNERCGVVTEMLLNVEQSAFSSVFSGRRLYYSLKDGLCLTRAPMPGQYCFII